MYSNPVRKGWIFCYLVTTIYSKYSTILGLFIHKIAETTKKMQLNNVFCSDFSLQNSNFAEQIRNKYLHTNGKRN